MIRFYMAAPFAWKQHALDVSIQLSDVGDYKSTARWLHHHDTVNPGPNYNLTLARYANEDYEDVLNSNLLVLLEPVEHTASHGREVELGMALAEGLTVWLVGPHENIFHYLVYTGLHSGYVKHFHTVGEMLTYARTDWL